MERLMNFLKTYKISILWTLVIIILSFVVVLNFVCIRGRVCGDIFLLLSDIKVIIFG